MPCLISTATHLVIILWQEYIYILLIIAYRFSIHTVWNKGTPYAISCYDYISMCTRPFVLHDIRPGTRLSSVQTPPPFHINGVWVDKIIIYLWTWLVALLHNAAGLKPILQSKPRGLYAWCRYPCNCCVHLKLVMLFPCIHRTTQSLSDVWRWNWLLSWILWLSTGRDLFTC